MWSVPCRHILSISWASSSMGDAYWELDWVESQDWAALGLACPSGIDLPTWGLSPRKKGVVHSAGLSSTFLVSFTAPPYLWEAQATCLGLLCFWVPPAARPHPQVTSSSPFFLWSSVARNKGIAFRALTDVES